MTERTEYLAIEPLFEMTPEGLDYLRRSRAIVVEDTDDEGDEPCPINRRPKSTCPSDCGHGSSRSAEYVHG